MTEPTATPQPPKPKTLPLPELRACFLSDVQFRIEPTWKAGGDDGTLIDISASVAAPLGAPPPIRQVTVTVKVTSPEGKHAPYTAEVRAVAVIEALVTEGVAARVLDEQAAAVGGAVAYGAIREELQQLSARGPHPKLLLPLVEVRRLVQAALNSSPQTSSQAGKQTGTQQ